ncbi:MAG: NfeD family protein [Phycisphaerales bacterium]|nr:NfeD family protein [Phycisphaerales bacterium]
MKLSSTQPIFQIAFLLTLICILSGMAQQQATAPIPAGRSASLVAVLPVRGVIDRVTVWSLQRRLAAAIEAGADAVVLDLDTPGGEMTATLDICLLIKTQAPANTVAWINPQAYSAGTIIALACREIIMAPGATFGDAAPIAIGPGGLSALPQTERAKIESPLLAEVIDSARRNHYDENLVQGFISVSVELWLIENKSTGQRVFVDRPEFKTLFGQEPTETMTPVGFSAPSVSTIMPWWNTLFDPPNPGGFSSSPQQTEQEKQAEIEFQQTLPSSRQRLTANDRDQWQVVGQVLTNDRLLTLKAAEASHYGLVTAVISNDQEISDFFGASRVILFNESWSEGLVRFLLNPWTKGTLIVVFILALFIELASGSGVFALLSISALLILIGAPALVGMTQWWDIMFIGLGLVLIGLELFVIPGFGFAGVAGVVVLLIGLIGTFISGDVTTAESQRGLWVGITTVFAALFAAACGIWIISRYVHTLPLFDRAILRAEVATGAGPDVSSPITPKVARGDIGLTETDLRPSGRAVFADRPFDVTSAGEYIAKGTPVQVISVDGLSIQVEEA